MHTLITQLLITNARILKILWSKKIASSKMPQEH